VPKRSVDEIRKCFELSNDFNEIFEAFEHALAQRIDNIELYRLLFWNHSLSTDELCLFGEKLAAEFSHISYDVYMWLASVFEVTSAGDDNFERTLDYYRKAASVRPSDPDPYLDAADCYDPDIKIPPLRQLIDFLKQGAAHVVVPKPLYQRLIYFYDLSGNDEMSAYYRRILDKPSDPTDAADRTSFSLQ
jgi:tetratricopeptide (TPR) repeat protein